jgi:hypothetical protein
MSKDKKTLKDRLMNAFLESSGIKAHFDEAYDKFVELSDQGVPLPVIAKDVAPNLRPVVRQFTGIIGKAKLGAASAAVSYVLSRITEEEIQGYLDKAKQEAQKDVSKESKDVVDVAQKFLDGVNPENLAKMIDQNKGAINEDMIEDLVAIAGALRATLPPKLSGYLADVIPDLDRLDDKIREEVNAALKEDTSEQLEKVIGTVKEKAAAAPTDKIGDAQKTLVGKLDEVDAAMVKRIIDHISDNFGTNKIYGLMVSFFNFADEALTAFEQDETSLRDYKFKHGSDYQKKIAEFLQLLEDALDKEGLLPERLDIEKLKSEFGIDGAVAPTPQAPANDARSALPLQKRQGPK